MTEVDPSISVVLVKGDDETLVGEQVSRVVDGLLGGEERSLALDEFTIDDLALEEGGYSMASFLDALSTPPFLSERRVVLVRHAGVFSSNERGTALLRAALPGRGSFSHASTSALGATDSARAATSGATESLVENTPA